MPGPSPWSAGIGKESKTSTRTDCVCSNTVHGAVLEFFTSTWPAGDAPGYSHWSVAAKRRPECAASASISVSCAAGLCGSVVSGCRAAPSVNPAGGFAIDAGGRAAVEDDRAAGACDTAVDGRDDVAAQLAASNARATPSAAGSPDRVLGS